MVDNKSNLDLSTPYGMQHQANVKATSSFVLARNPCIEEQTELIYFNYICNSYFNNYYGGHINDNQSVYMDICNAADNAPSSPHVALFVHQDDPCVESRTFIAIICKDHIR